MNQMKLSPNSVLLKRMCAFFVLFTILFSDYSNNLKREPESSVPGPEEPPYFQTSLPAFH